MGKDTISCTGKDVKAVHEGRAAAIVDAYRRTDDMDWDADVIDEEIAEVRLRAERVGKTLTAAQIYEQVADTIKKHSLDAAYGERDANVARELDITAQAIAKLEEALTEARAYRKDRMQAGVSAGYGVDDVARWSGLTTSGAYRIIPDAKNLRRRP